MTQNPGSAELETLRRLRAQRYGGEIRLMVIDSSPDPHGEVSSVLRAAACDWLAIRPSDFRHAGTRQLALEACATPVIVYLSGDAHPTHDRWLQRLVQPLLDGRAEASYGRQVAPTEDPEREATYAYLYPDEPRIKTKASIASLGLRAFHFSDVSSAFLTDVARTIDFPIDLPIYEDVGIAKRLLDRGLRIAYVPDAAVIHVHHLEVGDIVRRYWRIGSVYQRLGIFTDLRRAGCSLMLEGLRATKAVSPKSPSTPGRRLRSIGIGGLKAAAVTLGRAEACFRWGRTGAAS